MDSSSFFVYLSLVLQHTAISQTQNLTDQQHHSEGYQENDQQKLPHIKYDTQERQILPFENDLFAEEAGDRAAGQLEVPYHVQMHLPNLGFFCSGTLVRCPETGRQIVVTAAHCVCEKDSETELNPIDAYTLHAGILGINDEPPQYRKVILQVVHPRYKIIERQLVFHDIAILVPERDFDESEDIQAIPLNNSINPPDFEYLTIVGWGTGREQGHKGISSDLRVMEMPIVEVQECNLFYFKEFGINMVNQDHLCAGYAFGTMRECQEDSGGGAVANIGGKTILAGVASWGKSCGKRGIPGVYAKVSNYLRWILNTSQDIFKTQESIKNRELSGYLFLLS